MMMDVIPWIRCSLQEIIWTTPTSTLFLTFLLVILLTIKAFQSIGESWGQDQGRKTKKYPPSPFRLPIIGHMHQMAAYHENPWEGFSSLARKLGDVYFVQMGIRKILVVSSLENIREVLLTKGDVFVNRPDFQMYNAIFNGDRENALALCDWSRTQRIRRTVAQMVILPRFGTNMCDNLNHCIREDMKELLDIKVKDIACSVKEPGVTLLTKSEILFLMGNIFSHYLCSKRFPYGHDKYSKALWGYDYIFNEINQSYPWEFLPWLTSIFGVGSSSLKKMSMICNSVKNYMEEVIITPRLDTRMAEDRKKNLERKDFLDVSLENHFEFPKEYPWHVAVYEVLDLIGGSSAVGNLAMRTLGFLSLDLEAQKIVAEEAKFAREKLQEDPGAMIDLNHRSLMPFTEACLMETLRLASSPIIPHVANRDSTIGGFDVDKDTIVLFNTYILNMSDELWENPKEFNPKRFLVAKDVTGEEGDEYSDIDVGGEEDPKLKGSNANGKRSTIGGKVGDWKLLKPDYFLPFSCGRRACLGYKMVMYCAFVAIGNLCSKFILTPEDEEAVKDIKHQLRPHGNIALPLDDDRQCFRIKLASRE